MSEYLKAKQLAEPGTDLPDGFPAKATLALAGYVADADLVGADEIELIESALLSAGQAKQVLAALAAL